MENKQGCNVRRATKEDLEKLISFTLAEAIDSEGLKINNQRVMSGIKTALEDESIAKYWVLEASGSVIGSISVVMEWSDWNAGYYWWIQSMYIDPQFRGQGLMKLLLNDVMKKAREEQAVEVRLYVHHDNTTAIKAYATAGFEDSEYKIMRIDI